jgi:Kef-type K+ transport system membrane component KefB
MRDVFQLFAVAAVVMGMAQTISKERIFAPLRERLGGKETWFGYLVSCPYCASHYLAFLLVPLTGTYAIDVAVGGWVGSVLRWFLSSILLTVIAAFYRVIFWFVDETQGLVRRRQRTEEEETATKRLMRKQVEQTVSFGDENDAPPPAAH